MLPHAPGVQMADIPEDSVNLDKEVGKHSYVEGKTETFCGLRFYRFVQFVGRGGGRG